MYWLRKRLAVLFSCFLLSSAAMAAVSQNLFVTVQTPVTGFHQFTSSSSALVYATVITGGSNGTKVNGLWVASSDASVAHTVYCAYYSSSTNYGGVTASVPAEGATSNYLGPAINLLSPANWAGLPVDSDGNPYLFLASGDVIQCTFVTSITSGNFVSFFAMGGNF